jgi:hypothetical protein
VVALQIKKLDEEKLKHACPFGSPNGVSPTFFFAQFPEAGEKA